MICFSSRAASIQRRTNWDWEKYDSAVQHHLPSVLNSNLNVSMNPLSKLLHQLHHLGWWEHKADIILLSNIWSLKLSNKIDKRSNIQWVDVTWPLLLCCRPTAGRGELYHWYQVLKWWQRRRRPWVSLGNHVDFMWPLDSLEAGSLAMSILWIGTDWGTVEPQGLYHQAMGQWVCTALA